MIETLERTPTLPEVLRQVLTARLADVHTAIPASVERYDAATQKIDAKPLVKTSVLQEDGTSELEPLPVIPGVPVVFPGGGGFRLVFPLKPGDTVLLVFSEAPIDKWKGQGGDVDPLDGRRHHLSDAIAIPGLHPFNRPWSDAAGDFITIGLDGGLAEFVAIASKVSAQLSALKTAITNAVVVPTDGGASFKTTILAALATWPGDLASAAVKVKG